MVLKIKDVKGVKVPLPNERILKVLACPELGAGGDLTVLVSIITPGGGTGLHTHDVDEYMYVATGSGQSICKGDVDEVASDSLIFAPKGVEHEIRNTGEESLKLFCVYVPALKTAGYFEQAVAAARDSLGADKS